MKVLVANIGSTSFKYKLFDMPGEHVLAKGGAERIGKTDARCYAQIGDSDPMQFTGPLADHGQAIKAALRQLTDPKAGVLKDAGELSAIGFKAVIAKNISGVQIVDDNLLQAMAQYNQVAPAHNPPYISAMEMFRQAVPHVKLVAAFETGFHQDIPLARQMYAVPYQWYQQYGIRRFGFHGASTRYVAGRIAELTGRSDLKLICCHLGGSSSVCAVNAGKSVGASMGFSPQSGLPQNNRVGDLDVFTLPVIMKSTGLTLEQVLAKLAGESGFQGVSGVSNDLREIEAAAANGNERARLAMDMYIEAVRHYLGAYVVALGGLDALAFTGGIGQNSAAIREGVCRGLEFLGVKLDAALNGSPPSEESRISPPDAKVQVWVIPTDEELIVARQTFEKVNSVSNKQQ